jgi:UDP-N-acetylglucosamine:LPS N-acetylglucosamine transferase
MSDVVSYPVRRATVATVTMGYGHLRAAAAIADRLGVPVEFADRPPLVSRLEQRIWAVARRLYHGLSRGSQSRLRGAVIEPMLDRLTAIEPGSRAIGSAGPVRLLDSLIRLGLGRGLGRRLDQRRSPLVATFYANALAAERHTGVPIALVVTDSDVHRVWAPREPDSTRIHFLVPTDRTGHRLTAYGVPADHIHVTGFPLPMELVGSQTLERLDRHLAARRRRLDAAHGTTNPAPCIVYSVGGAGAQAETARELLRELAADLRAGRIRLVIAAGTHTGIARRCRHWQTAFGLDGLAPDALEILHAPSFGAVYRRFNDTLADADILWTKPSELVFYGALGLPLVLEPPVGAHERCNRDLVIAAGVAVDRPQAGEIARWIRRHLADGSFAGAAVRGLERLPADGTRAIERFVSTELYTAFTGT